LAWNVAPREERDGFGDCEAGAGGGTVLVLPAQTIITGVFAHDVASALPFVETRVDVPGQEYSMVLTDGERLVAFVRAVSGLFLSLKSSVLRLTF
jgi:hypothetical protein